MQVEELKSASTPGTVGTAIHRRSSLQRRRDTKATTK